MRRSKHPVSFDGSIQHLAGTWKLHFDRRLRVRRCGPAAAGTISRRRILALLVNHPDGTPDQDDDLHPLAGRDLPPKTTARGFPLMRPIYLFAREAGM